MDAMDLNAQHSQSSIYDFNTFTSSFDIVFCSKRYIHTMNTIHAWDILYESRAQRHECVFAMSPSMKLARAIKLKAYT